MLKSDFKKTPKETRENWFNCSYHTLCSHMAVDFFSAGRKTEVRENETEMTEPCSSHLWHQSDWSSSVTETGLAATFPELPHTRYFTFMGAICYSSGLVPLCLSGCLPNKTNNVTLLRLFRLWPVTLWEKRRRRTWRRERGEWRKEKVTLWQRGWYTGRQCLRALKAPDYEARNTSVPFSQSVSSLKQALSSKILNDSP